MKQGWLETCQKASNSTFISSNTQIASDNNFLYPSLRQITSSQSQSHASLNFSNLSLSISLSHPLCRACRLVNDKISGLTLSLYLITCLRKYMKLWNMKWDLFLSFFQFSKSENFFFEIRRKRGKDKEFFLVKSIYGVSHEWKSFSAINWVVNQRFFVDKSSKRPSRHCLKFWPENIDFTQQKAVKDIFFVTP